MKIAISYFLFVCLFLVFYEISIKFLCEAPSFCLDPMSNFFAFEINRMEMCGIVLPLGI